jgi:hypothetical protein
MRMPIAIHALDVGQKFLKAPESQASVGGNCPQSDIVAEPQSVLVVAAKDPFHIRQQRLCDLKGFWNPACLASPVRDILTYRQRFSMVRTEHPPSIRK